MKLEKYRDDSYEFSKQTSELIRQFAFAGIAIIWIFKIDKPGLHLIPQELIYPLLMLVIALIFDLCQYLIPTIIWTIYYRIMERRHHQNTEVDMKASGWWSVPGWICFSFKTLTLINGYYFIIKYLTKVM